MLFLYFSSHVFPDLFFFPSSVFSSFSRENSFVFSSFFFYFRKVFILFFAIILFLALFIIRWSFSAIFFLCLTRFLSLLPYFHLTLFLFSLTLFFLAFSAQFSRPLFPLFTKHRKSILLTVIFSHSFSVTFSHLLSTLYSFSASSFSLFLARETYSFSFLFSYLGFTFPRTFIATLNNILPLYSLSFTFISQRSRLCHNFVSIFPYLFGFSQLLFPFTWRRNHIFFFLCFHLNLFLLQPFSDVSSTLCSFSASLPFLSAGILHLLPFVSLFLCFF